MCSHSTKYSVLTHTHLHRYLRYTQCIQTNFITLDELHFLDAQYAVRRAAPSAPFICLEYHLPPEPSHGHAMARIWDKREEKQTASNHAQAP